MALKDIKAANNAKTELAQAISPTDTAFIVKDAGRFPEAPFRITIDSEIMEVGKINKSTNTLSEITRGIEGTIATNHELGASVENRWTAGTLQILLDNIQTTFTQVVNGKAQIAAAINDMNQEVANDADFHTLAAKIKDISKDATALPHDVARGKTYYAEGKVLTGVGDSNLKPSNVRNGVTIHDVTGSMKGVVDFMLNPTSDTIAEIKNNIKAIRVNTHASTILAASEPVMAELIKYPSLMEELISSGISMTALAKSPVALKAMFSSWAIREILWKWSYATSILMETPESWNWMLDNVAETWVESSGSGIEDEWSPVLAQKALFLRAGFRRSTSSYADVTIHWRNPTGKTSMRVAAVMEWENIKKRLTDVQFMHGGTTYSRVEADYVVLVR